MFKVKALIALGQIACFVTVLNGCGSGSAANNSTSPSASVAATGTSSQTTAATPTTHAASGATGPAPATTTTATTTATQTSATQAAPATTSSAGTLTATNSGDACLPIAMPTTDAVFNSPKKIFAHYLYSFPVSIDNRAPAVDYYNTQYLNRYGESGKWLAEGGFLRQRPLGINPSTDPSWKKLNMEREVAAAIARGITGFTFDVMSVTEATNAASHMHLMLAAAQAVDSRFKIIVMPDLTALGTNADAVVEIIASAASSPAAYRLADGRLVVSAFDANRNSPAWWASVISRLKADGINVAFVPTFLGWTLYADLYASISYGFGDWGTATPHASSLFEDDPAIAHDAFAKIFMTPVDTQQFRPKNFQYWEAGNSASFTAGWNAAIQGGADWVQLVTWNDFSESGQVTPYTDATLRRDIGTGYYDLTGYYAAWFLTGRVPTISHDVLYYFYRREPTTASAPAQSQLEHVSGSDPAQNYIELLGFLTAPGDLKITIGGTTYTKSATAAGVVSLKVPLKSGIPLFTLSRNGATVFSFEGGVQIYGTSGLPSGVADMTYWSGSASQSGICAL